MKPRSSKDGFGKKPFGGSKPFGGGRKFGDKGAGGGRGGFRDDRFKPASVPEMFIVEITSIDDDGDIIGQPLQPIAVEHVLLIARPGHSIDATLRDHVLVKLERLEEGQAVATMMRILPRHRTGSMVGVLEKSDDGWQFRPSDRQDYDMYPVAKPHEKAWEHGVMVRVTIPGHAGARASEGYRRSRWDRMGAPEVQVVEVLAADASRVSLLSIHGHNIPMEFSPDTLKECKKLKDPVLTQGRVDLRDLPLVTIDGEDAKDFDDAVFAERLDSAGGRAWRIVVAIADVAHYVRHGSSLDNDAFERGNSVYFPDRVVPMLPERLSNDLCSLRPDEDRYCMAMEMWLDESGSMVDFRLQRGIMRSKARLTYNQVQAAIDGKPDKQTKPLLDAIIKPLYEVYGLLAKQRDERGALEINSTEYKVEIGDDGTVAAIYPRPRFDSHKLIEEFMILANVAAARLVQRVRMPGLYRNHEVPSKEKSFELRDYVKTLGLDIHIGANISAKHFNQLLRKVKDEPIAPMVNQAVLRSQMQAFYGPERVGHFGLALRDYAHFTSPIRRYSDLIIHRALIAGLNLGDDGLSAGETKRMTTIGEHISLTERKAMTAERESKERYAIMYLADRVGEVMEGMVSGFSRSGFFVTLKDTGVDGYIPLGSIDTDYFVIDERSKMARGRNTGATVKLGDRLAVRLDEANSIQKRLRLTWIDGVRDGQSKPRPAYGDKPRGKGFVRDGGGSYKKEGVFKPRREDGERPAFKKKWEDRPERSGKPEWKDRPARDDAPREERPAKPWDKKDKPFRSKDNFKPRGEGGFKPRVRDDGEERPRREWSDKPPRRREDGERPARGFKPREEGGFRPRRQDGDERPRREWSDKPPRRRDEDGERPERSFKPRGEGEFRPRRQDGDERPRREWSDKPPRRRDEDGERPARGFKPREEGGFRQRRDDGDRPERSFKPRGEGRPADDKPRKARGEFKPRDGGVEKSGFKPRSGGAKAGGGRPKKR
jgi:ribonuclease R